jgi:hypothetical protein
MNASTNPCAATEASARLVGPDDRPPPPRKPDPALGTIRTFCWHVRECFRPKSLAERVGIALAKAREQ